MNALIFIIVLLFGNADISPAGVAVVWGFLVVVEWRADSFARWLILHRQRGNSNKLKTSSENREEAAGPTGSPSVSSALTGQQSSSEGLVPMDAYAMPPGGTG